MSLISQKFASAQKSYATSKSTGKITTMKKEEKKVEAKPVIECEMNQLNEPIDPYNLKSENAYQESSSSNSEK